MQPLPLMPGDRLMFLTDGMLERNVADVDLDARLKAGAEMAGRRESALRTRAPTLRSGFRVRRTVSLAL